MIASLKMTQALLAAIRADLDRRHAFAHERVGFISAGISGVGDDILILPRAYMPVADEDYLHDPSVGAMMGPDAIRKALEWCMRQGHVMLHVHTHGGKGVPGFSAVDIREYVKFIPDFFKVTPQSAHGALVLSHDAARGQLWLDRKTQMPIESFVEVGASLRKWGTK